MSATTGTLYGIGVGPGDPELITLKAVKILNKVSVVFAAASTKNKYSLALSIAKAHIPDTARVEMLFFSMAKSKKVASFSWNDNAKQIIDKLENGNDVAFVTLGDPMTYSTFGYILQHMKIRAPHISIVSIPGITSYQAAASRINTPLVEGEESLLILSGVSGGDRLRKLDKESENIVFLKAYKNVKNIVTALDETGRLENSVGISGCGLPEERIIKDIRVLKESPPDYWTLIIAKNKKKDDPQKS